MTTARAVTVSSGMGTGAIGTGTVGTGMVSPAARGRRRGSVSRADAGSTLRLADARPAPLPRTAYDLIADAGRALGLAIRAQAPGERFAAAHLAALRGAAAVLAARARPRRAARGSAWELLPRVAPELAEWAAFFAAGSAKRQAAQAGLPVHVLAREADDMVRQAAAFLDLVDRALAAA